MGDQLLNAEVFDTCHLIEQQTDQRNMYIPESVLPLNKLYDNTKSKVLVTK